MAASQFKELWESGCTTPAAMLAALTGEAPRGPDSVLIERLRAVECDADNAISALADWLQGRADPRALAIQSLASEVARWGPFVKKNQSEIVGGYSLVEFGPAVGGCNHSVYLRRSPEETEDSLLQRAQKARTGQISDGVWERLGLSWSQAITLKRYLGINRTGTPATVEVIALQDEKRPQTIRNRIELALHRLFDPKAQAPATMPKDVEFPTP
jgi:hypothetical protein